uniref:Putative secreted peptide n=1 Tax=Anopheles braziliensis TaxID=58242 RepID=A0A2M3ZRC9_9DIPT
MGQYGHFNLKVLFIIGPLLSLLRASRDITCPQSSFMGGLSSELCCRRIGQANIEWNRFSGSRSISMGNSSRPFQMPVT